VRGGVDGSSSETTSSSSSKALLDSQIRGLEAALEEMRRKKQAAACHASRGGNALLERLENCVAKQ